VNCGWQSPSSKGNTKPTHARRTLSGASPGGTSVMRIDAMVHFFRPAFFSGQGSQCPFAPIPRVMIQVRIQTIIATAASLTHPGISSK
jgi:hypothetical protein